MVERLVNQAAAELGIDAPELRRRNFIPPEAFPYKTPTGSVYEIADLPGLLEQALKLADWHGFAARRAQSAAAGKLRGIGISTVIENTGAGNAPKDESSSSRRERRHHRAYRLKVGDTATKRRSR